MFINHWFNSLCRVLQQYSLQILEGTLVTVPLFWAPKKLKFVAPPASA
jgi:hypothetical protein